MFRFLLLVPLLVLGVVPAAPPLHGCAPAPRRGESVGVNGEEAIILYDAAAKTEHFIRRADFRTEAKDFGFLVPTPTQPDLGVAEAHIFGTLSSATAPRRVPSGTVHRVVKKRNQVESAARAGAAAPSSPPTVLDEKKGLAGYDLVVLKAADLDGLKTWLEKYGYDARPALMQWLEWYVEHGWIITAFKVSQAPNSARDRWAKAVRMSFQTEAPFYPYREPEDARMQPKPQSRTLRVFYLGDARASGTLGETTPWAAKTMWANACPDHTLKSVAGGIGLTPDIAAAVGAKKWHLTEFEDDSSPRPGTHEVFFHRSADQTAIERPVILYDQYEYVYEDGTPVPEGERHGGGWSPEESDDKAVWLVVGIVGGSVAIVAVGLFVALKLGSR